MNQQIQARENGQVKTFAHAAYVTRVGMQPSANGSGIGGGDGRLRQIFLEDTVQSAYVMNHAATKIQGGFRGMQGRRRARALLQELLAEFEAAVTMVRRIFVVVRCAVKGSK